MPITLVSAQAAALRPNLLSIREPLPTASSSVFPADAQTGPGGI